VTLLITTIVSGAALDNCKQN